MDDLTRLQMGPEGPVQLARIWIEAVVRDRDLRAAWPLAHPDYRGELANAWVNANAEHGAFVSRDLEEVWQALAHPAPEDQLWEHFEATTLGEFNDYWSFLDLDSWGWMSDPRPHGPNTELVYLVDMERLNLNEADGHYEVPEDAVAPATGLLMKLLDKHRKTTVSKSVSGLPTRTGGVFRISRSELRAELSKHERPGYRPLLARQDC